MENSPEEPAPDVTGPEATGPDLSDVIDRLRAEEHTVEEPMPGALQIKGRFSNPERIALRAAAEAGDRVVVWATSHREDWVLVCWDRPELVTITQRGPTPQRWRHRQLPTTLNPDAQTFLEGVSSPFDIVTRPKHQPTDFARRILDRFGIVDPEPPGWVQPEYEVAPAPVAPVKPVKARAPRPTTPRAPAKPEPVIVVCPNCFMAIPSTGICDNCG